jgi:signal transduction histidine kinase
MQHTVAMELSNTPLLPGASLARLEQLQAELAAERAARQEAERRAGLKDEFLTVVAHELRAPLGAISGWAHMLRCRSGDEEELERGLDVIEQSAQVQAKLIEDLLVASRMASNRIRLDIRQVDLPALIDAAVESVRPAASEKDIALVKFLQPVGPARGDPTRLRQVICNLLTNAIKFTPRGGRVEITLRPSHGWAALSVRDTGMGIAPEFLPKVFDRFSQAPAAPSEGGLGLGLAIARHLAELHGGEITAASEGEGRGATFTVRLPLVETRSCAA